MSKYGFKKSKNRCENEITFFFIFSPNQDFQKNNRCQFEGNIVHYRSDKRDLKRNIFVVLILRVKTKFLKKDLKIREISRKKVFARKTFQDGNFENVQTHVNR